ncbi:MAG: ABC transporter permease subunit [Chthoniobacteraceae bacterium]
MTSLSRITAIAGNTLLELVRQKVFYFMLLFATVAIGAAFAASAIPFAEVFQVLKDASLGAMTIFSWLLVTLATAMILPKDLEDRTLYTILAKPVSRLEYLLGKLLGVLLLLAVALALMSVLFSIALLIRERIAIAGALRDYGTGPDGQAAIAEIKRAAFDWNLVPAILVIFTKSAVCAALTLLLSTFASSWIFTVMISVSVYVIGHLQPLVREAWLTQGDVNPSELLKVLMGFVSLVFPDFQLFNIVDEIVVGNAVPGWMFGQTFALGFGYVFVYTLVGYIAFSNREI